ncbi:MAG TPA: phytanoyl-CoA dioxygenase family protein [Acidimicrobiia bacterium]|nr:phytanoyl-CoA dioxygenase family protein [Acidimicrobiia bacterium]
MSALTSEPLDSYRRDGFVRLDAAFSHELAARCRARLWEQLDESPDDPSTWTRPVARLGAQLDEPFREAVASPRWLDAIHAVAGRDAAPEPWLGGTVAVRFPIAGPPNDDGWHVDGSYAGPDGRWWLNARSDGRALLMLVLLSDVGPDDAPTRLRVGSHVDVPDALAPFGDAGVASLDFPLPARALARPIAFATGRAGDVYLCHPFLVHAAQRHHGREPRFVAQPGVPWANGR